MPINRRIHRAFVAWIAIFAVLCHALMPAVSRLHAAGMQTASVEACHQEAHASGGKSPASPLERLIAPQCGFCMAGLSFATPPTFDPQVAVADAVSFAVRSASVPSRKTRPLLAAPSRGPPVFA